MAAVHRGDRLSLDVNPKAGAASTDKSHSAANQISWLLLSLTHYLPASGMAKSATLGPRASNVGAPFKLTFAWRCVPQTGTSTQVTKMDQHSPLPDFLVPDAKPFDFLLLSLAVVSMNRDIFLRLVGRQRRFFPLAHWLRSLRLANDFNEVKHCFTCSSQRLSHCFVSLFQFASAINFRTLRVILPDFRHS
jgi:hypothetical protein